MTKHFSNDCKSVQLSFIEIYTVLAKSESYMGVDLNTIHYVNTFQFSVQIILFYNILQGFKWKSNSTY